MTRSSSDIIADIENDLKNHDPLIQFLPGDNGDEIYESYPAEDTDYHLAIILSIITSNTSPRRGVESKTWRIQVTVKASRPWRESQSSGGTRAMRRVMDEVGEVLGKRSPIRNQNEIGQGSDGGSQAEPMDGGYLAIANDWMITGYY